jgi:hypothetical protein
MCDVIPFRLKNLNHITCKKNCVFQCTDFHVSVKKLMYIEVLWKSIKIKLKVKVKFSLCLTKHHAMKAYWGSGGIAPRIL